MAIKLSELLKEDLRTQYAIRAKIETGLSVGAAGVGSTLADKPVVKDGRDRFIIPGSHLKGRLRHECEKLARALGKTVCESPRAELMCPQHNSRKDEERAIDIRKGIRADFPDEYGQIRDEVLKTAHLFCAVCRLFGNPEKQSVLLISDLVWEKAVPVETIRNRVAINRRRSTAEDKKLFFIETAPVGGELDFTGTLTVSRALTTEEKKMLVAAFAQIHALGGGKTGGAGWLRVICEGLI
ncbi:MAG: RAMP superfamily CRISPR-associated protein [Blastocatellia bacterium]|nr:RAMP superfamily CRISPR-associated protein [Blastocatellia bacterium]